MQKQIDLWLETCYVARVEAIADYHYQEVEDSLYYTKVLIGLKNGIEEQVIGNLEAQITIDTIKSKIMALMNKINNINND